MKNIDAFSHVRGESVYVDDVPVLQGTLYAVPFGSPHAHAKIAHVDLSEALASPGIVKILTAKDIPGENQIGGIIPDEELLASHTVDFQGMPVALIIGETEEEARAALSKIKLELEPLPIITDPREAAAAGRLIQPPRTFRHGNVADAWKNCAHIFEGKADSGGQEHLYIETQGAYAMPLEKGRVRIISSTQGPTAVQRTCARVLGKGMHDIEVDVTRLGGGFGGKEDQATVWAIFAALAALSCNRPVKCILHRMDDMRMTGKRHPYSSDFKIGLSENLEVLAFEATLYQDAGAAADLSPAVLERSLFHATNSYHIPHTRVTAYSCKTNVPPNTAFRGFGGPQGMFVIESALTLAAEKLGVPTHVIQEKNLLKEGDVFPYGQKATQVNAKSAWKEAFQRFEFNKLWEEKEAFNAQNTFFKKGLAVMPICFGISFTKTFMNNARALVHVYSDGSVAVSTGAVEMGQGVNTKMLQVAAQIFGISPTRVRLESTNTTRVANTSPTAASATADLNGKATALACSDIKARLLQRAAQILQTEPENVNIRNEQVLVNGKPTDMDWKQLVTQAFLNRDNLSAKGHYATPDIHFDASTEKGHPFAYHVYGTALVSSTIDVIRGTYVLDAVRIVHDYGTSMNLDIDKGQIEGGLIQGLGWMTLEELCYNKEGRLLSNALSTYKIPDIYSVPAIVDIHPLDAPGHELAILGSKAVGEPPLMYGIGAYFSLRNAIRAVRPEAEIPLSAPMTPEKVMMAMYPPVHTPQKVDAIS